MLDVDDLVREFVKHHRHEIDIIPVHHRIEDRVAEPAERRVRRNTTERNVVAIRSELCCFALRRLLRKIAAVTHTSDNRVTPALWLQRELRCGYDIPDNVVALQIRIASIAVVVGKPQHFDGKLARLLDNSQAFAEFQRRLVGPNHVSDRLTGPHDGKLTTSCLYVIAAVQRHHASNYDNGRRKSTRRKTKLS